MDGVRDTLKRANASPETWEVFEHDLRAWSRGSVYLDLRDEQNRVWRGPKLSLVIQNMI